MKAGELWRYGALAAMWGASFFLVFCEVDESLGAWRWLAAFAASKLSGAALGACAALLAARWTCRGKAPLLKRWLEEE